MGFWIIMKKMSPIFLRVLFFVIILTSYQNCGSSFETAPSENLSSNFPNIEPNPSDLPDNKSNPVVMYSYSEDLSKPEVLQKATLDRKQVYFFVIDESKYESLEFYCCKNSSEGHKAPVAIGSAPFIFSLDLTDISGGVNELYLDATPVDSAIYIGSSTSFTLKEETIKPDPEPIPTNATLLFEDTFESGSIASSQNGVNYESRAWYNSVNTDDAASGLYSIAASLPGDTAGQGLQIRFDLGKLYKEVTIKWDWFIPVNMDTYNDVEGKGANKVFRIWHREAKDGADYSKFNGYYDPGKIGAQLYKWKNSSFPLSADFGSWGDSVGIGMNSSNSFLTPDMYGTWVSMMFHAKAPTSLDMSGVGRLQFWMKKEGQANYTQIYDVQPARNHNRQITPTETVWSENSDNAYRHFYIHGTNDLGSKEAVVWRIDNIQVWSGNATPNGL